MYAQIIAFKVTPRLNIRSFGGPIATVHCSESSSIRTVLKARYTIERLNIMFHRFLM